MLYHISIFDFYLMLRSFQKTAFFVRLPHHIMYFEEAILSGSSYMPFTDREIQISVVCSDLFLLINRCVKTLHGRLAFLKSPTTPIQPRDWQSGIKSAATKKCAGNLEGKKIMIEKQISASLFHLTIAVFKQVLQVIYQQRTEYFGQFHLHSKTSKPIECSQAQSLVGFPQRTR